MTRRGRWVTPALCAAAALGGCAGSPSPGSGGASGSDAGGGSAGRTVTVFAAASLREAFTTVGRRFEETHPGTRVVLSFGASSTLAAQIAQGAPADVFASASPKNMADLRAAGAVNAPVTFARNTLTIAVPAGNPARVTSLNDLGRPGVKVAVCQPAVPCGAVADRVFAKAGVNVEPVSREADVKAVLTKVTLGEVDAGLVYTTDVRAAGSRVQGISLPATVDASTAYPIATLTSAPDPAAARDFVAAVRSATGTAALTAAGFVRP